MKLIKALVLIFPIVMLWGCASPFGHSSNSSPNMPSIIGFDKPRDEKNFADYIDTLKRYVKTKGIDEKTIKIAFTDVHFVEHVILADKNQPEKKSTLDEYLARSLSPAKVQLAKHKYSEFYQQISNATVLTRIPQSYILALWGTESGYGRYQGKEDVISALSTLAFEGRREAFFTKELIAALMILQNGHIEKSQFKGSWAGAMGQCQFMPSSYLSYGLDGDGDGVIDIWSNMSDVFASIANYLATVGWQEKERWGNKITLTEKFNKTLAGLDDANVRNVSEWLKLGIKFDDGVKPNTSTPAWVIIPDADSNQGYLVYRNFKTLMHWNRSYSFAISVGMLAESLDSDRLIKDKGIN